MNDSVLADIKKSYAQINVLLIKSKALSQTLTDVTSVDEVEFALHRTKRTFANRHLRNSATQILAAYIVYLREKEVPHDEPEDACEAFDARSGWIKFDFTNSQSFTYTLPIHCVIGGAPITKTHGDDTSSLPAVWVYRGADYPLWCA